MEEFPQVDDFLRRWASTPATKRPVLAAREGLPVSAFREAALRHGDPWVRRTCLDFLDHHANDSSTPVFLAALDDPVAPVRLLALHGLACERCRTTELYAADVTPTVVDTALTDSSPEVRHAAVPILLRLSDRSPEAGAALRRVAEDDPDPLVRHVADAALAGDVHEASRSRRTLRRRARSRAGEAAARAAR